MSRSNANPISFMNSAKLLYLKTYNVLSFLAWAAILFKDAYDRLPGHFYRTHKYVDFPHKLLTEVQVANAVFEILHSLTGLVPSPLPSLLLQFFARLVITLGISFYVPESPGNFSAAYSLLTFAWAVTEMGRYAFYAAKLSGPVPRFLLWFRYLSFIVLYPMGVLSEPLVVYQTLGHVNGGYYLFLALGMFLYPPGFVFLYLYMWQQRQKYLVMKTD